MHLSKNLAYIIVKKGISQGEKKQGKAGERLEDIGDG